MKDKNENKMQPAMKQRIFQCKQRFLANFVNGDEAGFALNSAVSIHNVQMYAPANQPRDFHCNVNNSRQKLTV